MRRWQSIIVWSIFGLLDATRAEAHLQASGLSDFNAGLIHPLLTLPHVLALIALGLMCGQRAAALLRYGLPALAVGLMTGFTLAAMGLSAGLVAPILTALTLLAGLAVAANFPVGAWAGVGLGFLIGIAIGLESNPEVNTLIGQLAGISGTSIAVLLIFLNIAALAAFAALQWQRIGLRVIGSWTSAAAFLNIALLFRK